VFSDTVGFIKKLPHQLVESFKSTLEEVHLADLLLHVVDASDPFLPDHIAQTEQILTEIGAAQNPVLLIYNKIDKVGEFVPQGNNGHKSFLVSALDGTGLNAIKAEIIARSEQFARRWSQPG
jgi:GTP-binding protein HflX